MRHLWRTECALQAFLIGAEEDMTEEDMETAPDIEASVRHLSGIEMRISSNSATASTDILA